MLDEARIKNGREERKAVYEKLAGILLSEGSILYLYHQPVIIAHTTRLSGYKPYPDGLIRVVDLTMK